MYLQRGESLADSQQALAKYNEAYKLAQQEIKILTDEALVDLDELELAFVHITAGDCRWAMSKRQPDRVELEQEALDHWERSREIAGRVNFPIDVLIEQSLFKCGL